MGGGAAAPASRAANWASEKSGEEILRCAGKNFSGLCGGPLKLLVLKSLTGWYFLCKKFFPRKKIVYFFSPPFISLPTYALLGVATRCRAASRKSWNRLDSNCWSLDCWAGVLSTRLRSSCWNNIFEPIYVVRTRRFSRKFFLLAGFEPELADHTVYQSNALSSRPQALVEINDFGTSW